LRLNPLPHRISSTSKQHALLEGLWVTLLVFGSFWISTGLVLAQTSVDERAVATLSTTNPGLKLGFSAANSALLPPQRTTWKELAQSILPTAPAPQQNATSNRPSDAQYPGKMRGNSLIQFVLRYNPKLSWDQATLITDAILGYSQQMNVDYRIITSVLAVESSFRTDAVSSAGAIGLGQLKPSTAQWLGISNPYDPIENIAGATKYIRFLLDRYSGDVDVALSAYYQGQGTIDRNGITENCKPYLTKISTVIQQL
jgi:hypothetical protein